MSKQQKCEIKRLKAELKDEESRNNTMRLHFLRCIDPDLANAFSVAKQYPNILEIIHSIAELKDERDKYIKMAFLLDEDNRE